MINSMTAFSRYEVVYLWGSAVWEIRSMNQRYLDICITIPKNVNDLFWIIRKKVKSSLTRGKIECHLQLNINVDSINTVVFDNKLFSFLLDKIKYIKSQINEGEIDLVEILSFPGIISYKHNNDVYQINNELLAAFELTLYQLIRNREKEGSFLKDNVVNRLLQITTVIDEIQKYIPQILQQKRKKLLDYIQGFCINFDTSRLEQELLLMTQKIDVSEEIDRLKIHVESMQNLLSQKINKPVGRQLDFITQELQREANTLSSKLIDAYVTGLVISLKILIEQIREQVQNIE
ncbi:uncharacterized stress-induced protein; YicC-like family(N-term region)stationary phase survival (non-essential) [Candidatus Blochmanniella floridana]|uniref:Uncharacterized stress-induced protein YicC-like family(N-term region)stationary phase survival (Non-essential) n=1 Tax=Blochmanniella floridana TaxID=203907 RepID=Q7VRJ9_BLOFL|nr:uncharacterized stress-induced protein; YicC-like family(N-term region)stationary phase survival (non-essential) [Candidatus Blochmannia floridanus]